MIKDGLSSCQDEKELEYLRVENVALRAQLDAEKRRADAAVEALNKISDYNGSVICRCNEILKIANEWRGEAGEGGRDG